MIFYGVSTAVCTTYQVILPAFRTFENDFTGIIYNFFLARTATNSFHI
jgi:hypothetical protein